MPTKKPFLDWASIAAPGLQHLQPYQPGKPIEELERELGVTNAIKLASNENPLGLSRSAKHAIEKAQKELSRYPDGSAFHLKKQLAEHLKVGSNQLTIGNGSNEILELLGRAFLTPETSAIVSAHAFVVYDLTITALSARKIEVPARNWGHDLAAMVKAVDETTRMIFIANPNNPTGTWVSGEDIEHLLLQAPPDVLVVVDEAYYEYVDKPDYASALPLIARFPNLVVTRTFSKAYGLAALRMGYSISHPAIAELLNRLRQPFNVNSLALAAAQAVLQDAEYLQQSLEINRLGYQQLVKGFETLGFEYIPSAGNFIAVRIGSHAADIYQQLLREGVIVRPIASYGMAEYLRVSIGLPEENQRFLEALEKVACPEVQHP